MVASLVSIAVSAAAFGGLHLVLKKGSCGRSLERMYLRRQRAGKLKAGADPKVLASQAEIRILNEVHNIAVLPLGFAALFQQGLNCDKFHGTTPLSRLLTAVSAGYFCTDVALVASNFKEHGPEPAVHALICSSFMIWASLQKKLHYFAPRVLLFECSTPFVHMRWLLHSLGLQKSLMYKINGVSMIVVFFCCRVLLGASLLHDMRKTAVEYLASMQKNPVSTLAIRIMSALGCGIMVLNGLWFYKMLRGAFKVFLRPSRQRPPAAS